MLIRSRLLVCLFLPALSFAGASRNKCSTDPNQWTPIFNGKDLAGWTHIGPGNMTVDDTVFFKEISTRPIQKSGPK